MRLHEVILGFLMHAQGLQRHGSPEEGLAAIDYLDDIFDAVQLRRDDANILVYDSIAVF